MLLAQDQGIDGVPRTMNCSLDVVDEVTEYYTATPSKAKKRRSKGIFETKPLREAIYVKLIACPCSDLVEEQSTYWKMSRL